jgi:hypothetical protein
MENEPDDVPLKLSQFLMQYRITPHTTTQRNPSKIMFGRNIRSRLDNLQQERNSAYTPKMKATPIFSVGQPTQIRFYNDNSEWKFGTVLNQIGPSHNTVLVDGK